MKLYRALKAAPDGLPQSGPTKRTLGVRPADQAPNHDVPAVLPDDAVRPGTGGMSVAPDTPANFPRFLRPPAFGGTGKDFVWEVESTDLPAGLTFRQDRPTHGMIEPTGETTLAAFRAALEATRRLWRLTPVPEGDAS